MRAEEYPKLLSGLIGKEISQPVGQLGGRLGGDFLFGEAGGAGVLPWLDRPADAAGLRRPMYGGFRVAMGVIGGCAFEPGTAKHLEERLSKWIDSGASLAMPKADLALKAAWDAAAVMHLGMRFAFERSELACKTIERFVGGQQGSGAYFDFTKDDNAESWWYCELVVLEAMVSVLSVGVERGGAERGGVLSDEISEQLKQSVKRAAVFHLNETQPDHATMQPWGLSAMVIEPEARPLADWMLGAMQVQYSQGLDVICKLLLKHSVYVLQSRGMV